jgi:glyoxylase-like metal-dependent hydrolase (beta-lactamase superfamily II)/ferredoxin
MAKRANAVEESAPGAFFVDRSCIDCGTCYTFVPEVFGDAGEHAFVRRQPDGDGDLLRASQALVACPTASIGTDDGRELARAARSFPHRIDGEVYFCGYTSEASFGAWSYLIRRDGGNVLMDSPRAAGPLLARIEELGGVRTMVLSHRDDVADHARIAARFRCERLMHRADVHGSTRAVERQVEGREPVELADDLLLIPTPGHTAGSVCLLHREFLFTGDTLWWNPVKARLSASRSVCWHSWPEQLRSLERLLEFEFTWVLPGHGAPHRAASSAGMRGELERALEALRRL